MSGYTSNLFGVIEEIGLALAGAFTLRRSRTGVALMAKQGRLFVIAARYFEQINVLVIEPLHHSQAIGVAESAFAEIIGIEFYANREVSAHSFANTAYRFQQQACPVVEVSAPGVFPLVGDR